MAVRIDIRVFGESLDLPTDANTKFFITKQIYNILSGLETREGDFSRPIELPRTEKNNRLTSASIPINYARESHNFLDCQVLFDGVPVVTSGRLLVAASTRRTITATIYGGNTGFFVQLKDAPLSALNLSAYNFNMDESGLAGNRTATSGVSSGWGAWTDNLSFRTMEGKAGSADTFKLQYPNVYWSGFYFYIYTLLEEIFSGLTGLTVDMSKLDANFNSLALAVPVRRFVEGWDQPAGLFARGFSTPSDPYTQLGIFPEPFAPIIPAQFDDPAALWDGSGYVFPSAGLVNIYQYLENTNPGGFLSKIIELSFTLNGVEFYAESFYHPAYLIMQHETNTSVTVEAGDKLQILSKSDAQYGAGATSLEQTVRRTGATPDLSVIVAEEMPDIKQNDFVLNCLKWFNIVATELDGVVTLSYWDNIASAPAILSKDFAIKDFTGSETLGAYAQSNALNYAENDLIERTDTTGTFEINSNALPTNKEVIKLIFSAADQNEIPLTAEKIVSMPLYAYEYESVNNNKMSTAGTDYSTLDANGLSAGDMLFINAQLFQVDLIINSKEGVLSQDAGVIQSQDWERLTVTISGDGFHVVKLIPETTPSFNFYTGPSPGAGYGNANAAHFPTELLFSSIVQNYFKQLARVLGSPAIVWAWLDLSVLEFVSLDQTRPIYIESLSQNFYINKIEQFKTEGLVRLQLVKV